MDEKALVTLAVALAKRVNDLATDDNNVFTCVHPDPEDCPRDPEDMERFLSCDRCLAKYFLPTLRKELGVTK